MNRRAVRRSDFDLEARRQARRRKWRFHPRAEGLEARTLLAVGSVDIDGLRFVSSAGFEVKGNEYSTLSGTVSLGYVPDGTEAFLPLIEAELNQPSSSEFLVNADPGSGKFSVRASTIVVVADPSAPIPIWQPNGTFLLPVDIGQLTGAGFSIPDNFTKPFEVASVDFALTEILFANPDGGSTADAQVKMQGAASFDKIAIVKDLGVKAAVNGTNYVIAQATGISLTGLDVTVPLPGASEISGIKVAGFIDISYNHANGDTFSFGGGVTITTKAQGSASSNLALDHVSAGVQITVASGKLTELGFDIAGKFSVFSLDVSTVDGQPFSFDYNIAQDQFEIGGGLLLEFRGNSIKADFGDQSSPGIIIKDGLLTNLNATFNASIEIFGATLTTDPSNGLVFIYNTQKDQFEMGGGLTLSIPSGETTQTITASMLDGAGGPGLIIVNGQLTQLDLQLSGGFSIYGLKLSVMGAGIQWLPADDSLLIGGTFNVDFDVFQTSLALGTAKQPGLKIVDGKFMVDAVTFTLENVGIGPLELNDLVVSYTADGNSFDLGVAVNATLPGGITVGGEFDFVMGKLDTISVDIDDPEGIVEVADTGLLLTSIHVKVTNIDDPSAIVFYGSVAMIWGETIQMFGKEVNLFRVEGDITASAQELIIDAQAQMGAYSSDGGTTWNSVLGDADAKLTLDWTNNFYALHVVADGLLGIFDVEGDLVFSAGKDIVILAEATVVIPSWVPFIGGDKIGGVGFFFQHIFPQPQAGIPTSTTFAAWIELDIIWTFTVGFEVVIDAAGDSHFSLIGGGTVSSFQQAVQPPVNQTYTFTTYVQQGTAPGEIPPSATSMIVGADWTMTAAGVTLENAPIFRVQKSVNGQTTTYTEDQFAANGISFVTDSHFSTPTSKAIQIVGSTTDQYAPITAQYTLLVDFNTEGGSPFPDFPTPGQPDALIVQASYHIPKPTFGPTTSTTPYTPALPTTSPASSFPVTLNGNVDEALLSQTKVSIYRVLTTDPFRRGVLVGTQNVSPIRPPAGGVNWQATFQVPIDGLYPDGYQLYAILNDGFNRPEQSLPSVPFTPNFAVQGIVSNQNKDPKAAWVVFLDYNANGEEDPNEPRSLTNPGGFYSFTRTFDPATGWAPVPTSAPFPIVLVLPDPKSFAPLAAQSVHFNGTTQEIPINLRERTAIKGQAFVDQLYDGVTAHGTAAPGVVVYLDLDHNGRRDPTDPSTRTDASGRYSFTHLAVGAYTVAIDLDTLAHNAPEPAYAVNAGVVGNQTDAYSYGNDFVVNEPIVITSLGVFDSGSDGLRNAITAVLFDTTTGALLAQVVFPIGQTGTLMGGSRFLPLPSPIRLPPGFRGTIAAFGYGQGEPADNAYYFPAGAKLPWSFHDGAGRLTALGGRFGPSGANFPTLLNDGPPAPFAAGSFLFRDDPWTLTTPASTSYSVTVDASGFDLVEGNDFGLLPPAYLSGTVVGHGLANGSLQPTLGTGATPQPGWASQGIGETLILALNVGGLAIDSYTADGGFSGGSAGSTTTNIDTSRVVDPAPQFAYQNYRSGNFTYTLTGLLPEVPYDVRLHFAEPVFTSRGQRVFNVAINGKSVLTNFDVYGEAAGVDKATTRFFQGLTAPNGSLVISFTGVNGAEAIVNAIEVLRPKKPGMTPRQGWTVQLLGDQFVVGVNVGGGADGAYIGDTNFSGGTTGSTSAAIDTSKIFHPAPQEVYQDYRLGAFSYTITGLTPQVAYAIRLHFVEPVFLAPGERQFNVAINGAPVLENFDIVAESGNINTAIVRQFEGLAGTDGRIVIRFDRVDGDDALVSAIEILAPNQVVATATTDIQGHYIIPRAIPGTYTIREVPPAGWRQIAPFHSDLALQGVLLPPATNSSQSSALADFNGDGAIDMVLAPEGASGLNFPILYFVNGGNGTFGGGHAFQNPNSLGQTVLTGDFNGDKRPDLLVFNYGGPAFLSVYLNTGSADPSQQFQYAEGYWSVPSSITSKQFIAFAVADLNGDGLDDIALSYQDAFDANGGAILVVFLNATDPTRRTPTVTPLPDVGGSNAGGGVAIGDVNGDGHPDIVINGGEVDPAFSTLSITLGDGKGGFSPWISYFVTPGSLGGSVALADISGKGVPDIAALGAISGETNFGVQILTNRGTGIFDIPAPFGVSPPIPQPPPTRQLALADLDGDGRPDLIMLQSSAGGNPGPDALLVYINTGVGPGYFDASRPLRFPIPGGGTTFQATSISVADINGDGLNDVIVTNDGATPSLVFLNVTRPNQPGIPVSLSAGGIVTGNHFLNVQDPSGNGSSVVGQLFDDANRNGRMDTNEAGTAGSLVFVDLNRNGRFDPGEPSAPTIEFGAYAIAGLPAGTYSLGAVNAMGGDFQLPSERFTEVTVGPDSVARLDLGRVRRLLNPLADLDAREGRPLTTLASLTTAGASGRLVRFSVDPDAPAGLSIDPATGAISWNPTASQASGSYLVTVRARDAFEPLFTDVQTFTIVVAAADEFPAFVRTLYREILGREADPDWLDVFVSALRRGVPSLAVVATFWESPEARGNRVDRLYSAYLDRAPTASERAAGVVALESSLGEIDLAAALLGSNEYRHKYPSPRSLVEGMFLDTIGRRPTPRELWIWVRVARNPGPSAARRLLTSRQGYAFRVGSTYLTLLGREASLAESNFWVRGLLARRTTLNLLAETLLDSDQVSAPAAESLQPQPQPQVQAAEAIPATRHPAGPLWAVRRWADSQGLTRPSPARRRPWPPWVRLGRPAPG